MKFNFFWLHRESFFLFTLRIFIGVNSCKGAVSLMYASQLWCQREKKSALFWVYLGARGPRLSEFYCCCSDVCLLTCETLWDKAHSCAKHKCMQTLTMMYSLGVLKSLLSTTWRQESTVTQADAVVLWVSAPSAAPPPLPLRQVQRCSAALLNTSNPHPSWWSHLVLPCCCVQGHESETILRFIPLESIFPWCVLWFNAHFSWQAFLKI